MPILRMLFAGSVDDGKSTLMGRLFYDAGALPGDQIDQIAQFRTMDENKLPDFSLFTDGLREERTKGITIDVAYRYFRTKNRQYIVADTPGHFHFTRNMITGASTAELIVFLVDVQQGMVQQTKLHMEIADQLEIKQWIVCVNKMDRVDYQKVLLKGYLKKFNSMHLLFIIERTSGSCPFLPYTATRLLCHRFR